MNRIIILNGASSVGKTSVARELQYLLGPKYLYISIDHFIDMLSPEVCNLSVCNKNFLKETEGFYAFQLPDKTYEIKVATLGKKLLNDTYKSIEALLKENWNIIFTVVEPLKLQVLEIKERFKNYNPYLIYLYASEDIIIKREKSRGDRLISHTINLIRKYNSQDSHDLKLDTSKEDPNSIAQTIISKLYTK